MEELGSPRFEGIGSTIRKKRSQTFRRPKIESSPLPESRDQSPLSSTPPSDDVNKFSSDENTGDYTNFKRKEFSLNQCALRDSSSRVAEYPKKIKERKNGGFGNNSDQGDSGLNHRRSSEGMLAPANWINTSKLEKSSELFSGDNGDAIGHDNRVKKVKLKVGGVTRTIQTKSNSNGASGSESSLKSVRTLDGSRARHKLILQEDSDEDHSSLDKNGGLRGIPWKDFSIANSKEDSLVGKMPEKNASGPTRKSKRVPKRRVMDGAFDEEDEDDEIKYLEKLKNAKSAIISKHFEEESNRKQHKNSRVSKYFQHDEISDDSFSLKSSKDGKKRSRLVRGSEDTDYEEEDLLSDGEPESKRKRILSKESVDLAIEVKREPALTTRQRALLSGKDASSASSAIEFPNGLPPVPPRKQKEKLTEVEQQLKKAEAAQRRRMQVEKAARESEAEAIRKILGQDSSRKKREDKIKKRQEELEQEKAANALKFASNTVRWVMGPTGTVVTFPNEMGLPSIFNPNPCSYPPPREKCAGPSCTNPYKYRDSKSKVPLCSLQCYKAVHEKMQTEIIS